MLDLFLRIMHILIFETGAGDDAAVVGHTWTPGTTTLVDISWQAVFQGNDKDYCETFEVNPTNIYLFCGYLTDTGNTVNPVILVIARSNYSCTKILKLEWGHTVPGGFAISDRTKIYHSVVIGQEIFFGGDVKQMIGDPTERMTVVSNFNMQTEVSGCFVQN